MGGMNPAELNGKPFTLWLTDDRDESAVFSGVARWDGSKLVLSPRPQFDIRSEWHERIKPVANDEARGGIERPDISSSMIPFLIKNLLD